jgi:hypothetical protein
MGYNKRKKDQINALLQAIYEENSVIMDKYSVAIGEYFKNFKEGSNLVLNFYDVLSPQDFTVYNATAALIGQIKDSELRKNIVKFYTLVKGFSATVIYTNKINLKFQDYLSQHPEYTQLNSNSPILKVITTYQNYLNGFMRDLKSQYNEIECSSKKLKDSLEVFLVANK